MEPDDIDVQAASWVIDLDEAENIDSLWPTFEAWLHSNPGGWRAFASMEATWRSLDVLDALKDFDELKDVHEAPATAADTCERAREGGRKTPLWMRTVCLVASIAVLALFAWLFGAGSPTSLEWAQTHGNGKAVSPPTYSTDFGERKTVLLRDGSRLTLNTNSALRVRDISDRREVDLDRGEIVVTAAPDPHRPFEVWAGSTLVRALGTQFRVRRVNSEDVETTVGEGKVQVVAPSAPYVMLSQGQGAHVDAQGVHVITSSPTEQRRKMAWVRGLLEFNGETLAEAVAEFNRYNRRKLVIVDPAIANYRMGGSFSFKNPDAFARAMERAFGIQHASIDSRSLAADGVIELRGGKP